jgi:hypothetical protein
MHYRTTGEAGSRRKYNTRSEDMERIEKSSPSSCLTHLKICDYHELNFTMEQTMTWKPEVDELEFGRKPAEYMGGPEGGNLKRCRDH